MSFVHRLPADVKIAAALACVLLVVLLPGMAWAAYGTVGAALLVIAVVSRTSLRQLALRVLLVEPMVVGIAVLVLFGPGGWPAFLSMVAKSTLCLACMVVLTATTRFSAILLVLRRLHAPGLLVTTLALMHRFMFVLVAEMGRMLRARRSRTFADDRVAAWRGSAQVAGLLFVRASERAERVYLAMCARGWDH